METSNVTPVSLVDGNITSVDGWTSPFGDVFAILTAVVLGILILTTILGNVFVIAAILHERNLQSVANYLIVSLAVADLMVACLVMPLGAVYEINAGWPLGSEFCDIWTSSDVLCCTASILHLVAIAVDRYWAVTDLNYIQCLDRQTPEARHKRPKDKEAIVAHGTLVALVAAAFPQILPWDNDQCRSVCSYTGGATVKRGKMLCSKIYETNKPRMKKETKNV